MQDFSKLKLLLDEQFSWPNDYLFKFILKPSAFNELSSLFDDCMIQQKASSKGKYISVTVQRNCKSSDEIISIYKQALSIESVITL